MGWMDTILLNADIYHDEMFYTGFSGKYFSMGIHMPFALEHI